MLVLKHGDAATTELNEFARGRCRRCIEGKPARKTVNIVRAASLDE